MLRYLISEECTRVAENDWIYYSDGDSVFMNFSEPLTKHLPPEKDSPYHIIFSVAPPTAVPPIAKKIWRKYLNSGAFFIKKTEFTRVYMAGVIEYTRQPCDQTRVPPFNGWFQQCPSGGTCCSYADQSALQSVLYFHPLWEDKVKYVGFRDFNSMFPFYGEGDLVVHFAGLSTEQRQERILAFHDVVDTNNGTFRQQPLPRILQIKKKNGHTRDANMSVFNAPGHDRERDYPEPWKG